jgi:MtrB/PioB family decaheme-associated outer membrane protein
MVRRSIPVVLATALAAALPVRAQDAPPPVEPETSVTAVAGAQGVSQDDERGQARFEEFRDVQEGPVLEFGRFAWEPKDKNFTLSLTAFDAGQNDQRYFLESEMPGRFSFAASYVHLPRFYSSGSKTLWSGVGSGRLTLDEAFRQGAENAAGPPTSPFASPALQAYMQAALDAVDPIDIKYKRKDLNGAFDFTLAPAFTLSLTGRQERREGTRPSSFGTYIRRQALSGVPGTGTGNFWRETIEARGAELIEPLDWKTTEFGATLVWAKNGHSASAGYFGSRYRNDITALYFDNPFEATPGRASATIFDPRSDQEPPAPGGNNQLRGLYARSVIQLWPDNDYDRLFGNLSLRIGSGTRLNATVARGTLEQNDRFLPYAENDQVVFSGTAGQPGVVYAIDAPLPRASLDGEMETTQADVKLTSRLTNALNFRAGYRYYDLDDERPEILFPGFSSSGDSYFRPGIGQRDSAGNRILFNVIGGYTRERLDVGASYRFGVVTVDGEYARTTWEYGERQVEETDEDSFRGGVRADIGSLSVNAFYRNASRDFSGDYHVGLETSGIRAFDVWTRDRDELGAEVDLPVGANVVLNFAGSYRKDDYPGAVEGFAFGYGLQDSMGSSVSAGATYERGDFLFGAWAGYDQYEWNSLQVTKSGLRADNDPTNRWTRESSDDVFWVGGEVVVPLGGNFKLRADVNYQKFEGDWVTTNLGTPDINSAVAYPFPELSDSTFSTRASLLWDATKTFGVELRYWYEPYRLDDFTIDILQPYMQGVFEETRSSPTDVGPMNVSRFLFLDSRYSDYTAHVVTALAHLRF